MLFAPTFPSVNFASGKPCFQPNMGIQIVQQPPSKRSLDMREAEGAPRAKRRFERVSARFENFHIADNSRSTTRPPVELLGSSSSDEDDAVMDAEAPTVADPMESSSSSTEVVVEEPEDEDETKRKRLRLTDELTAYLDRSKEHSDLIFDRMSGLGKVEPGALTVWRPPVALPNPFDDPSMKGRIFEVEEEEELRDADGDVAFAEDSSVPSSSTTSPVFEPSVSYPDDQIRDYSGLDSISSSLTSTPDPSSPEDFTTRIVELSEGGTPTDSSQDEAMELD